MGKKEEDIYIEFMSIIRKKMSQDEFWNWVRSWFAIEIIIDTAKNWNEEDMKDTIEEYKKGSFVPVFRGKKKK